MPVCREGSAWHHLAAPKVSRPGTENPPPEPSRRAAVEACTDAREERAGGRRSSLRLPELRRPWEGRAPARSPGSVLRRSRPGHSSAQPGQLRHSSRSGRGHRRDVTLPRSAVSPRRFPRWSLPPIRAGGAAGRPTTLPLAPSCRPHRRLRLVASTPGTTLRQLTERGPASRRKRRPSHQKIPTAARLNSTNGASDFGHRPHPSMRTIVSCPGTADLALEPREPLVPAAATTPAPTDVNMLHVRLVACPPIAPRRPVDAHRVDDSAPAGSTGWRRALRSKPSRDVRRFRRPLRDLCRGAIRRRSRFVRSVVLLPNATSVAPRSTANGASPYGASPDRSARRARAAQRSSVAEPLELPGAASTPPAIRPSDPRLLGRRRGFGGGGFGGTWRASGAGDPPSRASATRAPRAAPSGAPPLASARRR